MLYIDFFSLIDAFENIINLQVQEPTFTRREVSSPSVAYIGEKVTKALNESDLLYLITARSHIKN